MCLVGDGSTFLHPATQSFLDDALWSPLHAHAGVFARFVDSSPPLRAALDAHFAWDSRYASVAHNSSSALAVSSAACVTEGWAVAEAARACYRDVLAHEAAHNVSHDWFLRLRTDFLARAALPSARCWQGLLRSSEQAGPAWAAHVGDAPSDGALLLPRALAALAFSAADDFEACVNATSPPEPSPCPAGLPWAAPQCRWLARLGAQAGVLPLRRLFAGKPHGHGHGGESWRADTARCADGKAYGGGECALLRLQHSGVELSAESNVDVKRGRFGAEDYAQAAPPGCVADAAGGPTTPAERRFSLALLIAGRTAGVMDEANLLAFVVQPLRELGHANTSLLVFDCTDTGLAMPALRCADTAGAATQWERLRTCWACAAAQGAQTVDYIVRIRPDLRFFEPASTRFFPPPGCLASRLRSARNPVVPILDTMFSYHFGNDWCEVDAGCGGSCASCMLNDDQVGIMDPAVAHPYFNTASIINTEAYRQYVASGGCPAGNWPEHTLARSLTMHGVCTQPITWAFRLARDVQGGLAPPGGQVVVKACANQFACPGQTCVAQQGATPRAVLALPEVSSGARGVPAAGRRVAALLLLLGGTGLVL